MIRTANKFLLALLVVSSCWFTAVQPTQAQVNPYTQPVTNSDVPQNLHTFTQNMLIEVMAAVMCQLIGVDPINPQQACLGVDPKTNKVGFVQNGGGLLGGVTKMIAVLYTPPISSSDYVRYLANNFGIAQRAIAAGTQPPGTTPAPRATTGTEGLAPLFQLWQVFANLTYTLFVFTFVMVGFGIMFRVNIAPKTAMNIQNSIPKIIVGLLMVAFSYAIAGLMVDLMYLLLYVILNLFIAQKDLLTKETYQSFLTLQRGFNGQNIFQVFDSIIGFFPIAKDVSGAIGKIIETQLWDPTAQNSFQQGTISIPIIGSALSGLVGWLVGWFFFFVIVVAMLWAMLKTFFMLLRAYINFLLDVIFAPFWVLSGIIPGVAGPGFFGWLRDMAANLLAFPLVLGFLLLGKTMIDSFQKQGPGTSVFIPPFIGNTGDVSLLGMNIGLGVILLTPQALKIMQDAFKTPQIKYLSVISQGLSAGTGVAGAGANKFAGRLMRQANYSTGENAGAVRRFLVGQPGTTDEDSNFARRWIRTAIGGPGRRQ